MAELPTLAAGIVVGLVIGLAIGTYYGISQPAKTVTSTQSVTTTQSITVTTTQTVTSTHTTFSIPLTYRVRGTITHYASVVARFIVFTSGNTKYNFTVSKDMYEGNLTNSLSYTVTLYSQIGGVGPLGTGGCGTLDQTVAWGSSTIIENWNC